MKFSPYVIDLLKQKSNKDFRLSGDCEYLALDIESVTGEHIGVNTLKRLLGFIDDEREPRPSTLDMLLYSRQGTRKTQPISSLSKTPTISLLNC